MFRYLWRKVFLIQMYCSELTLKPAQEDYIPQTLQKFKHSSVQVRSSKINAVTIFPYMKVVDIPTGMSITNRCSPWYHVEAL